MSNANRPLAGNRELAALADEMWRKSEARNDRRNASRVPTDEVVLRTARASATKAANRSERRQRAVAADAEAKRAEQRLRD